MKYYKPIDRAAFILFKPDYFSYETFRPNMIPSYVTLFETRFLLTDWDNFIFNYTTWDAVWNKHLHFQRQLSIILQKEFRS